MNNDRFNVEAASRKERKESLSLQTETAKLISDGKLCFNCGVTKEASLRRDDPGCITGEAATDRGTELILGGVHRFLDEKECKCEHPESHHVFLEESCQVTDCDCTKFEAVV